MPSIDDLNDVPDLTVLTETVKDSLLSRLRARRDERRCRVISAPRDRIRCGGEVVLLDSLAIDPDNARVHPEANMEAIRESLALWGQLKPLVVREENRVVMAGNGTMAAMISLGWKRAAVSLVSMTDAEAIGYALADNRTAELAVWDHEVVARQEALLEELGGDAVGWSDDEVIALRMRGCVPQSKPDNAPELPVTSVSKSGDLWLLGDHRLFCGNAINHEHVEKLLGGTVPFIMVTDPPYGVEYNPHWRDSIVGEFGQRNARGPGVVNDNIVDWSVAFTMSGADVVYVWHASWFIAETQQAIIKAGYLPRSLVIWVKQHFSISQGHYHWKHEPCWYAVKKGKTAKWSGDRKQTTVWEISSLNPAGRVEDRMSHGTQKPVECMRRPIRNHGGPGDHVYDPFVGSGTTIIACQQLGRRCYAMDIDPRYVDVCLQRFLDYTGIDPIREYDGVTFGELFTRV